MEKGQKFLINGGKKLQGTVKVSGSKNASLPILCAALLNTEPVILHNVPDISDIHALLKIFEELGVKCEFENQTLKIDASNLTQPFSTLENARDNLLNADLQQGRGPKDISENLISSMRAAILLLGPLLARCKEVNIPFPGGCVLGKRSIFAHTYALEKLGAKIINQEQKIHLTLPKSTNANITMPELSVTATENALMLAVLTPGLTEIRLAAMEPHVQDLCDFLVKMGAKIEGIGTHFLRIEGVENLHSAEHSITGDYLEAGTFAIAALLTGGELKIEGIATNQLDSFWQKLEEMQAQFTLEPSTVTLHPSPQLKAVEIRTAVYPSFPTDLQAPFAVLLTQAEGDSKVFETLFEGRLNYLFELEKMGAKVEMLNPHQANIHGKTFLKGVPIASIDIRAGAAMVLAALCAEGTTEISNIKYIDRGYDKLEHKLTALGADIRRIEA